MGWLPIELITLHRMRHSVEFRLPIGSVILTYSPTHPPPHSPTRSLPPSLTHSPTYSLTHSSLTHSLTHSLTPLVHSLTHTLTHSPTHSLTHPLTHPLTRLHRKYQKMFIDDRERHKREVAAKKASSSSTDTEEIQPAVPMSPSTSPSASAIS